MQGAGPIGFNHQTRWIQIIVLRIDLLTGCAVPLLLVATSASAQDLQPRPIDPPPSEAGSGTVTDDQVQFTAGSLEYDTNTEEEWSVGGNWVLSKHFGLTIQYDSDHGLGAGLSFRL